MNGRGVLLKAKESPVSLKLLKPLVGKELFKGFWRSLDSGKNLLSVPHLCSTCCYNPGKHELGRKDSMFLLIILYLGECRHLQNSAAHTKKYSDG